MISIDLQNKLNLTNSYPNNNHFLYVKNINLLENKKYAKILYYLKEQDIEKNSLNCLLNLCDKGSLVLIAEVSKVNKRLSNGTEKYNKDIFTKLLEEKKIQRYWFLESEKEDCWDLLIEYDR